MGRCGRDWSGKRRYERSGCGQFSDVFVCLDHDYDELRGFMLDMTMLLFVQVG